MSTTQRKMSQRKEVDQQPNKDRKGKGGWGETEK